ncbi:MAG: hypothetical protein L0Y73_05140 [Candidatus Aminicenantes bacterium]|nr:hypothetical protein [Candidatus Aminicenantes bacterium]
MAGFEGVKWADKQLVYLLKTKSSAIAEKDAKVYAVSRSIHYGLFLAFEGIRFFCKKSKQGKLKIIFLNLDKNLERFKAAIAFNLSFDQQEIVPSCAQIEKILIDFFREPAMRPFLMEMAELGAQGYLRPFTFDEALSIGVTFPENPSIRAVACRYDRYLGEPFTGVVIPNLVRAVGINGMGCLKLAANYLISVKAVAAARQIFPGAGSALFLDDRPYDPLESRRITEWDSSCCLFALMDGTVIKIPESNLILPSVTIRGICTIMREMGANVVERDILYGELIDWSKNNRLAAVCTVGTAGIINRAQRLIAVDDQGKIICEHKACETHELYEKLSAARSYYWDIYREKVPPYDGMKLQTYEV